MVLDECNHSLEAFEMVLDDVWGNASSFGDTGRGKPRIELVLEKNMFLNLTYSLRLLRLA